MSEARDASQTDAEQTTEHPGDTAKNRVSDNHACQNKSKQALTFALELPPYRAVSGSVACKMDSLSTEAGSLVDSGASLLRQGAAESWATAVVSCLESREGPSRGQEADRLPV